MRAFVYGMALVVLLILAVNCVGYIFGDVWKDSAYAFVVGALVMDRMLAVAR